MSPATPSAPQPASLLARLLKSLAAIEPYEVRAVVLSMLYFFFLFSSYAVVKPVRDAMGTIYGVDHYQQLFTMTLLASLLFAPLYSGLAARIRLSTFLPWVYGFVALSIAAFYALFVGVGSQDRWIIAAFFVWVSTFTVLCSGPSWPTFSRAPRPSACSVSSPPGAPSAASWDPRSPSSWPSASATTT
jgi:AAA family ATP:ADP antiporter